MHQPSKSHHPHRTPPHKTYLRLTLILASVIICIRLWTLPSTPSSLDPSSAARNATLGFGAIYVLTDNKATWRVQGLLKAAELVGLDLTVPVQRRPSDEEVETSFLQGDVHGEHLGEVRAVMGYLKLLEMFLASGLETVLFMEDDVDFSVHVKNQTALVSTAIATRRRAQEEDEETVSVDPSDPYAVRQDVWQVLWLGHYGLELTSSTTSHRYLDPYALPWAETRSTFNLLYSQQAYAAMRRAERGAEPLLQQRMFFNSAPMASYAFALTRPAASFLLVRLRAERPQQFDVALHFLCLKGELRCAAPGPEVMHHQHVDGGWSIGNVGVVGEGGREDLEWWRGRRKWTWNVGWSARCEGARSGVREGGRWVCRAGDEDVI